MNITIDGKEYNTEDMNGEQQNTVEILRKGYSASEVLSHALDCVNAVNAAKMKALKESLEVSDDEDE